MKKIRILEKSTLNEKFYVIQRKIFGIWMLVEFTESHRMFLAFSGNTEYSTQQVAEKQIQYYNNRNSKKIIKEYTH